MKKDPHKWCNFIGIALLFLSVAAKVMGWRATGDYLFWISLGLITASGIGQYYRRRGPSISQEETLKTKRSDSSDS